MDILWKGLAGGIMTALIVLASRRGDVLPGILPLVPTFTIIALVATGAKGDPDAFRVTCLAGARTIPAYLAFLGTAFFLAGRVDYRFAILAGLAAWLLTVLILFLAPR